MPVFFNVSAPQGCVIALSSADFGGRLREAAAAREQGGFTLVEMLTTMAVLAVSLALAAPAMSTFLRNNRIRAVQSELVSSLMLARTEAARRGTAAGIAAKASSAAGGLARGWRVWVDLNGNGLDDDGDGSVLRDVVDLGASVVIKATGTASGRADGALYSPRGYLDPLSNLSFKVCSEPVKPAYNIEVVPAGMAAVQEIRAEDNPTCP